jgi:hypothetical protein
MQTSCCGGKSVQRQKPITETLTLYQPLIVVAAVSAVLAASLALGGAVPPMRGLMGVFLCLLATLKFFNLSGFADSFSNYDVVARRFRLYALSYPLLEMFLGCLYLSGVQLRAANFLTLCLMTLGSVGVVNVIRSGKTVRCACVGGSFALPVARVTLAENCAMAVMAVMGLCHLLAS